MNALTRFNATTKVKYDVMNTLCAEIEARDAELEAKNTSQDTEINKRVQQTSYDTKMAALDDKNTEQDTAISEKVKVNNVATNVNFISSGEMVETVNGKKFASNTDIIKDRANRTAEQINRTFYKQVCKEFTSDGSDITVNNGMDGYVLSGEIKGQTVKCVADKNIKTTLIQSSTKTSALTSKATDTNAKIYTYVFYASRIVGTPKVQLTQSNDAGSAVSVVDAKLGINTKTFTSNISDIGKIGLNSGSSTDAEIDIDYVSVVEGNASLSGYVPFGLSSTKAIIQNNRIQYPIYATQADKISNIPISLGGIGGVYDTLTLNEDGSGFYTQNYKTYVADKILSISRYTNNNHLVLVNADFGYKSGGNYICDKIGKLTSTGYDNVSAQGHLYSNTDGSLRYVVPTGTETMPIQFPITIFGQLKTPVVTIIPKDLMPTILTTKANTINLDSVVKASSLKVSLPVDRITELQSQVTALQNAVLLLQ